MALHHFTSTTEADASLLSAPSLLLRLKQGTQEQHDRLEQELPLTRPGLTLNGYIDVLERFYGFYAAWEPRIDVCLDGYLKDFFRARRKAESLVRDLRFFGRPIEPVPLCNLVPTYKSVQEALGAMYVSEGSTLGGQLISRDVERRLGLTDTRGCSFFYGYGKNVGRMWKTFQAVLLEHAAPQQETTLITSAQRTFEAIHAWLCGRP